MNLEILQKGRRGIQGYGPGASLTKWAGADARDEPLAGPANLFSGSFPINRRRCKPHFQQFSGIEFDCQSGSNAPVGSTGIQQFVVCSSDGESRHENSDMSVVRAARPRHAGPWVKLISVKLIPVNLVAVCKANRLQQSSAEGKAAIRLAADCGDADPQMSARPKPQLREIIFSGRRRGPRRGSLCPRRSGYGFSS
jgi:hypothetical protein